MLKKNLTILVVGCVALVMMFSVSLNVMAAYDNQSTMTTDKSDRTLLKEILINQNKTNALLQDIKASIERCK